MSKKLMNREILDIGTFMTNQWNTIIQNSHLNTRALYSVVCLKKDIIEKASTIQETVVSIAKQYGGVEQENGGIKVPDDKIDEVNAKLEDFLKETSGIKEVEIKIGSDDILAPEAMEALFDFIVLE